jgi:tRNA uridine 5-carbamoylmethylation protein Kti12
MMPEVLVTVSGLTGSGKSSVASEIDIALRSIGVRTQWEGGDAERGSLPLDQFDPGTVSNLVVTIREVNISRVPPGHFGDGTLAKSKAP